MKKPFTPKSRDESASDDADSAKEFHAVTDDEAGEEDIDESEDLEIPDDADADELVRISTRERLAAADALKEWIADEDPPNREILKRLEDDIRADRKLNEWGSFALDDLLRPPMIDPGRIIWHTIANWLTLLRNVALFLPVLLTWAAIDQAASAYSRATQEADTSTFLQVWQDASKLKSLPLVGHLTLAHVAFLDACIIIVLIALTVFAHLCDERATQVALKLDEEADLRFRTVMVNVGLFLHGFRQITPAALKSGLAEAVNQLVAVTTSVRDATEGMEIVATRAGSTLEEFAALSAREFAPAAERLSVMVKTLEDAGKAHVEMSDLVRALQTSLKDTIGSMESSIAGMSKEVSKRLDQATSDVRVSFEQTVKTVEKIGENLRGAAVSTSAAIDAMAGYGRSRRRDSDRD